jgi:hypothetical protein
LHGEEQPSSPKRDSTTGKWPISGSFNKGVNVIVEEVVDGHNLVYSEFPVAE